MLERVRDLHSVLYLMPAMSDIGYRIDFTRQLFPVWYFSVHNINLIILGKHSLDNIVALLMSGNFPFGPYNYTCDLFKIVAVTFPRDLSCIQK